MIYFALQRSQNRNNPLLKGRGLFLYVIKFNLKETGEGLLFD
jgi:hypothetical protein